MTAPLPPPDCAASADRIASAHDTVIGILEFAGLHRCPNITDQTRVMFCGCRPGECQQKDADNGR